MHLLYGDCELWFDLCPQKRQKMNEWMDGFTKNHEPSGRLL